MNVAHFHAKMTQIALMESMPSLAIVIQDTLASFAKQVL